MARLNPISIPSGVQVTLSEQQISVKGSNGVLEHNIHSSVDVSQDGTILSFATRENQQGAQAQAGTARAVIQNMLTGVSAGFEKRLELVGVGYRAQVQDKVLNLTLGFSHPVNYPAPEGITIETPSQTEVLVKGIDKQKVGQVAAEIRAYRPPEPYKGKGVKYADEHIVRKEAKKK